MSVLRVRLLGKLDVRHDDRTVVDFQPHKAQELFAYLLLHRGHSHRREMLANLLWQGNDAGQARKHLRQALWQLRNALGSVAPDEHASVLLADPDRIQVNPRAEFWLDVRELERACATAQGTPSQQMDRCQIHVVQEALDLYRGDLLEGWYEDWCLFERERLQQLYLTLLEKRMIYSEAHGEYAIGLECGIRALRCDVAHEQTHRRMMRLHYLAGDRTGALRQYQRCVNFLREELDVEPSAHTLALYEQIRADLPLPSTSEHTLQVPPGRPLSSSETLEQLRQLQSGLAELQRRLQEMIETLKETLKREE